jgi:hypothetical protein
MITVDTMIPRPRVPHSFKVRDELIELK